MALVRDHELHRRRFGRNVGVGLLLVAFAALMFGLTVTKIAGGGVVQAFDHTYRPTLDPAVNPAMGRGE